MNRFLLALGAKRIADAFRATVSGDPNGAPEWSKQMAVGNDIGFFGPDSDTWKVHGSLSTLVGGVRALLMQAAYPAALAGVAQHSHYDTDPLGRLERTTRWLTITSFGSTEAIEREAARVRELHKRVTGSYQDQHQDEHIAQHYSADQERHLLWVHCAFTDSFLTAYREVDLPGSVQVNCYVQEWSKSARPLGLLSAPQSDEELRDVLNDFLDNEIRAISMTPEIVRFLVNPPFSPFAMPFYRALCNAAISTMDPRVLRVLGIPPKSRIWLRIVKPALQILRLILGEESPSQSIARERIQRITSTS
jgi:uncharacterized protein (DUF2236 family)